MKFRIIPLIIKLKNNTYEIIFFVIYFITGLLIFNDYGLSWDEGFAREDVGYANYNYITKDDKTNLLDNFAKYRGASFELILVLAEKVFNTSDTRTAYLTRHFLNFLLFFISAIFFYFLIRDNFKNRQIALLGCAFLIFSPRIFADSFYNSKDLAFLSVFIINIYTLLKFNNKTSFRNAFLHAAISGFLIDIRLTGIIVPLISGMVHIGDLILQETGKKEKWRQLAMLFIYIAFTCGFIITFWPLLWLDPLFHFSEAFKETFHLQWESTVLFMGKTISINKLPWYYLPVWICITTPELYLVLSVIGLFTLLFSALQDPVKFYSFHKNDMLFMMWFFVPVLSVIYFNPVLYDGWRHLMFAYPAFLIFSLHGWEFIYKFLNPLKRGIFAKLFISFAALFLCFILTTMIRLHPLQNVYFNFLAGNPIGKFESDYWGLSFRTGLEYILQNDTSKNIMITGNYPAGLNIQILPAGQREKFHYTEHAELADYYLDNFRWSDEKNKNMSTFYSLNKLEIPVLSVYKIDHSSDTLVTLISFFNDFERDYDYWNHGKDIMNAGNKAFSGKHVSFLNSMNPISSGLELVIDTIRFEKLKILIKISLWKYSIDSESQSVLAVSITKSDGEMYFWKTKKLNPPNSQHDAEINNWKQKHFDLITPAGMTGGDRVNIYVWNTGKRPLYIDDFKIEILKYCNK